MDPPDYKIQHDEMFFEVAIFESVSEKIRCKHFANHLIFIFWNLFEFFSAGLVLKRSRTIGMSADVNVGTNFFR